MPRPPDPLQALTFCAMVGLTASPIALRIDFVYFMSNGDVSTILFCLVLFCHHTRPTQVMNYIPLLVNRFQTSILLIVQYKYLQSCFKDLIPQNLILRTRSCGTAYITQLSWLLHFHSTQMCRVEIMCTSGRTIPKRYLSRASPYFFA